MQLRNLLVCKEAKNEIELLLKKIYLKRIKEMFLRTLSLESIFNIFDEVFHGLSKVSGLNERLYSFYESLMTITSYYQHSQAGRGSLATKLLKELGTSGKMDFELSLTKLPQWLGQSVELVESELSKVKFDIVNKFNDNLVLCELKMKVYSGCTAGRVELMEKFNKFTKLIIDEHSLRKCIENASIKNIYMICGILFDIHGGPATTQKDIDWGICYNGLLRGKNDIIRTLSEKNIDFKIKEGEIPEKAFVIEYRLNSINVSITAGYGNEVIVGLFGGAQKYNIEHFKELLEQMYYDDLWLSQIIAISERTILNQNYKKHKIFENFLTTILDNQQIISAISEIQSHLNLESLKNIAKSIIENLKQNKKNILLFTPTPAEIILNSFAENYNLQDYIADIVQFLACEDIREFLVKRYRLIRGNY
ncbi:MAG: hypothetical protein N2517_05985 [Ignavibacteria bacterium]|nr:hypothetical protein [Ignavibacteria bacterium]